jgi:transposase
VFNGGVSSDTFEIDHLSNVKTSAAWSRVEVTQVRRRRWSAADKGRIVAESFERGARASDVARRHDISPQQLFQWRRQAREGSFVVPVDDQFSFAEVQIAPARRAQQAPLAAAGLEILIGEARLKIEPATDLDLLARILRLLRSEAS